jgi:hypothetical protein
MLFSQDTVGFLHHPGKVSILELLLEMMENEFSKIKKMRWLR